MPIPKNINVTDLLSYKLKQTQHKLRLQMDESLNLLELTTPQYAVLAQLELRPGISNADLARASFIKPQTMHGIVSNLEKRNLIKRKSDPEHGRVLSTQLTKKGLEVLRKAHIIIAKIEKSMTMSMNDKNRSLFEKLLVDCLENLNANRVTDYE